jgi:hypothetical protein
MNARTIVVLLATAVTTTLPAVAGPNDFFGGNIGNSADTAQGSQAAVNNAAAPNMTAPGGDYTVDEKRMQKKYRANVADAQKLIAKAEAMMKSADVKLSKKGKIMKEIGERRLADLKANNPFPEIANSGKKLQ